MNKKWGRVTVWFIFTVVLGMFPLIATGIKDGMNADFEWSDLLSSGELFVAAAVLAAGAIGELLYTAVGRVQPVAIATAGGGCTLLLVANTVAYASINPTNIEAVAEFSSWLFLCTLLSCAPCVWMAAES